MRTAILLILTLVGATAHAETSTTGSCARDTESLLLIPTHSVPLDAVREEIEIKIRDIVEHGILSASTRQSAELKMLPHRRSYRASYTLQSIRGRIAIDVIADDHGVIENYRLRENNETKYWCRASVKSSP